MSENLSKVDHAAMRVNQIAIIGLNILAFVLDLPWLAALVALAMVMGAVLKVPGFGFIYRYVLQPAGLVKPDVLMDNPEPHRFAQGLGGVFMVAGFLALWAGYTLLGWGLVWMVAALAALNAFGGFCVGCAVYYWLGWFSVPGFRKSPPAGTIPGMRPRQQEAGYEL
jgi:hypothetical protein